MAADEHTPSRRGLLGAAASVAVGVAGGRRCGRRRRAPPPLFEWSPSPCRGGTGMGVRACRTSAAEVEVRGAAGRELCGREARQAGEVGRSRVSPGTSDCAIEALRDRGAKRDQAERRSHAREGRNIRGHSRNPREFAG